MNIASAKQHIKDAVEAYMKKDDAGMYAIHPSRQRPIFLVGPPGIGKTAIMEQIAQELEIGIVSYSMTHHTRQSALGLPRIVHHSFEDMEYDASEYTMSEIVAAMYDYMDRTELRRGILFLDEINCVSETLYPSMLQFLQFKTFGRHRIPEDWIVVCAGNPPEYNRSVHEFDVVTLDRLREIEVEPDITAWRKYAIEKSMHPVVTTFLEAKPDCFYKVESKPGGGKSFVTARGWEDLAEAIALYEQLDKTINREFVGQYLRDDEIADKFAVYYSLFAKYRSDYQIGRILEGDATDEIVKRAKESDFDERIALLGLLLDSLSNSCNAALEQESVAIELRDELRIVKKRLYEGERVMKILDEPIKEREKRLARKIAASTAKPSFIRRERLVIALLKGFVNRCRTEQALDGDAAFNTLNRAYRLEVGKISPLAAKANNEMNNAFGFVESCFSGGREMLVFLAEITTRTATTQFVSHFGNEKYFEHNDDLKVDDARADLYKRVQELSDVGTADDGPSLSKIDINGATNIVGGRKTGGFKEQLAEYYGGKQFEYGFASMSKMTLPFDKLKGRTVLDVCCRRGKGVYKLSANVGPEGHVIGVDWSPSYIAEAQAGAARAASDNGLRESNMEFHVAYPEDLMPAGLGDRSVDIVYINNVTTLLCDAERAFREFARVLKPGGLLICETIFSDVKRDESVVAAARSIGNSIQAGRTKEEFDGLMVQAGFAPAEIVDSYDVDPSRGFVANQTVQVADSDETVNFRAVALNALKR